MKNQITSFSGEYRFLSNFWPCVVELDGGFYTSVEHAYQAAKTLNIKERGIIRAAETPGKAKRLGKLVSIRDDWETVKIEVMRNLLVQKFNDQPLMDMLLETGDAELIEGNNWGDTFWGVCDGVGENWLGKLLMETREFYLAKFFLGMIKNMNDFSELKDLISYLPPVEDNDTHHIRVDIGVVASSLKKKYPHDKWNSFYYWLGGYDFGIDKIGAIANLKGVVDDLEEVL